MKTHEKIMDFRGNGARVIPGNIFNDKGMLFGTFLMKNIFVDFPTPMLKYIFQYNRLKISCFLVANLIVVCKYIMKV